MIHTCIRCGMKFNYNIQSITDFKYFNLDYNLNLVVNPFKQKQDLLSTNFAAIHQRRQKGNLVITILKYKNLKLIRLADVQPYYIFV